MPAREYYTKHLTSSLCNIPFPNISWDLILKHAIYPPSQLNVNIQQELTYKPQYVMKQHTMA